MPKEATTLPELSPAGRRALAKASAVLHDGRNLMSVEQAAEYLGVARNTVYRLLKDGKIRSSKVGSTLRIRPSDLDAYFEQHIAS